MCGPFLSAWVVFLAAEHLGSVYTYDAKLAALVLAVTGPFVGAIIRYCRLAPTALYRWSYRKASVAIFINVGLAFITPDLVVASC